MFSASTFASLTLIAATAPVLSAPIPAAQGAAELDARFTPIPTSALKTLGEGLLTGGAIQGLEKLLGLAAPSTTAAAAAAPAAPTPRAFSDLSDDEVNQLLEWVNGHAPQARDLEARFSLPSGLLGKLVKGGITTGGISILGGILGKLTGGSDADSTATATAATFAPTVDSRAFSDLSDDEVNQLLEWVKDNANASQARDLEARLSFPSGIFKKILQGLAGGAGTQLLGGLLGGGGDVAAPSTEAATVPAATATAPVSATTPTAPVLPTTGGIATRGLASILEGLVGAGETGIEGLLSGFLGGGSSSSSTDTPQPISARQLAQIAEGLVGKLGGEIGDNLAGGLAKGVGNAIGSAGIGGILNKIFGGSASTTSRRAVSDLELSDDEVKQLVDYVNELGQLNTRGLGSSTLGSSVLGLGAELAGSSLADHVIDEVEKIFKRDLSGSASLDELD